MIRFITMFDRNYAAQGMTMLESLREQTKELRKMGDDHVRDHVLALDEGAGKAADEWCEVLLPHDVVYNKQVVDTLKLSTWKEYCWIMEVAWVLHALENSVMDDLVVYCDADLFFFDSPIPYITTGFRGDIGLTPHHFPPGNEDRAQRVGRYNFGFGIFRKTPEVMDFVAEWLEYGLKNYSELAASHQRYLDGCELCKNFQQLYRGLNVGPWQTFTTTSALEPESGQEIPMIRPLGESLDICLICYHFHEFRRGSPTDHFKNAAYLNGQCWNRTNYSIHPTSVPTIYEKYEQELAKWLKALA